MQCSVCGAEAENLTPGDFDGLIVRCKRCGEYEVRDLALNELLRLDFNGRVAALEKAKSDTSPEGRPTITAACL